MTAECPRMLMVLAVHIISQGTADGRIACTRHNRQYPALGDNQLQNIGKQQACFTAQHTGYRVESDEPVETTCVESPPRPG